MRQQIGLDNNHGHCRDCGIGWQPGPDNTESVKEITSGSAIIERGSCICFD